MNKIPIDIIINHIIPYTYCIQPYILLEDIKNYYIIKKKLLDNKYDTNIIKHEILAQFYRNNHYLYSILSRLFTLKNKDFNFVYNFIYKYQKNKRFNLLLGLFTKEERIIFFEYIIRDNYIWIKK